MPSFACSAWYGEFYDVERRWMIHDTIRRSASPTDFSSIREAPSTRYMTRCRRYSRMRVVLLYNMVSSVVC